MTADILRIILTTFPQYNHMWILNGEGEVKESGMQGMKKSNYGEGCKPNVYDPNVVECCEAGAVFNAATEGKLNGYIAMPGAPANVFYIKTNHQWVVSTHFLFVYNSTLYTHKVFKTQHFRGNKLVIIIRTLYNNLFLFST